MPDVEVGGQTISVERFSLNKSVRIITLLTELQRQVPEVTNEFAAFRRQYRSDYAVELDRMQALIQFPSRPLADDDDQPVLVNGEVVMVPSEVGRLTEADWERAGQVLKLPASPDPAEVFMHMAPIVFKRAQEPTMRLLALIAMDNEKVSKYVESGSLYERLDEYAQDTFLNADLGEVMELVVVAAEVIDSTVLAKARTLGKRLGPLRAMFGIETKQTASPERRPPVMPNTITSTGSPTTSDGSPESSDGSPSTSSATSSTSLEEKTTLAPQAAQ